jgi:hypothetical protein
LEFGRKNKLTDKSIEGQNLEVKILGNKKKNSQIDENNKKGERRK